MRITVQICVAVMLFYCLMPVVAGAAKLSTDKPLVVIDGIEYLAEDYILWRDNFKKDNSPFPDSPDDFINWHLMANEAKKMELFTLPAFQHKVDVFLKVRALMMLKDEEVDSKISITEEEILEVYNSQFIPRRQMVQLHFKSMEEAQSVLGKIAKEKPGYADLYKYAGSGDLPIFMVRPPNWYRPGLIPKEHLEKIAALDAGDFSDPIKTDKDYLIYQILAVKGYELADFEKNKEVIREKLRKEKHYKLTENLLKKLKKKYNVVIDEELLASLDILSPDPDDLDKILVKSDRSQVDVAYFVSQLKKQMEVTGNLAASKDNHLQFKWQILNSMVSNSLVDWEALDRHYEEKEPLKRVYQFYRQHRLITELESRIFEGIAFTDEETEDYYQNNIAEFTEPDKVKLTYVQGGEQEIKALWNDSIRGLDVMKAAHGKDVLIVYGANQAHNFKGLSQALQDKLATLSKGEVSTPFVDGGKYSLARLEENIPSFVQPYERVKAQVEEKLKKLKRDEARGNFIDRLAEQAQIKINDQVWNEIVAGQKTDARTDKPTL